MKRVLSWSRFVLFGCNNTIYLRERERERERENKRKHNTCLEKEEKKERMHEKKMHEHVTCKN